MPPFHQEPEGYAKTAWSDCQGAWENLRASVAWQTPFPEAQRLLFHIDEGMSWESVRNVELMRKALTLIENIARQAKAPQAVTDSLAEVRDSFQELLEAIKDGEA